MSKIKIPRSSPFLEGPRLHPAEKSPEQRKSIHHLFNIAKDVRETGLGNGGSTPFAPSPPRTPTPAASIITKCTAQVAAGLAAASLQIQISGGARSLHPQRRRERIREIEGGSSRRGGCCGGGGGGGGRVAVAGRQREGERERLMPGFTS